MASLLFFDFVEINTMTAQDSARLRSVTRAALQKVAVAPVLAESRGEGSNTCAFGQPAVLVPEGGGQPHRDDKLEVICCRLLSALPSLSLSQVLSLRTSQVVPKGRHRMPALTSLSKRAKILLGATCTAHGHR